MIIKRQVVSSCISFGTSAIRKMDELILAGASGKLAKRLADLVAHRGFRVVALEVQPTDLLVHDGYMCHQSGPNIEEGHIQKGKASG